MRPSKQLLTEMTARLTEAKAKAAKPSVEGITLPVPTDRQGKNYTCGQSVTGSVLSLYGVDKREDDLVKALHGTPKDGTHPHAIARYVRTLGIEAEVRTRMTLDDLRAEVKRGNPVIVAYQAWGSKDSDYTEDRNGHYGVVVGIDENFIYLMDPSIRIGYGYLTVEDFEKRWHDTAKFKGENRPLPQLGIVFSGTKRRTAYQLTQIE